MEQSKAEKLAETLEWWQKSLGYNKLSEAAAELRRLSAIEAERDALRAALAASCSEERNQMLEATSGGGCSRAIAAEAEWDALRAEVERLRAAPAPVAQPLSEAAINAIISQHEVYQYHPGALLEFSRAIIKAATGQEGGAV